MLLSSMEIFLLSRGHIRHHEHERGLAVGNIPAHSSRILPINGLLGKVSEVAVLSIVSFVTIPGDYRDQCPQSFIASKADICS